MKKETRLAVRINKRTKEQFFHLCELNGLCPSTIINRWIARFITKSKKNKIDFDEVYSASSERLAEYNEYKNS